VLNEYSSALFQVVRTPTQQPQKRGVAHDFVVPVCR
jgi:hypothetical protein